MSLATRLPTLLDTMIVCNGLPEDEIMQIQAFTGCQYDAEAFACESWSSRGPKLAIVNEQNEALVVGGFIPQRPGVYRSWFLARGAAWERGAEVTQVTHALVQSCLDSGAHRLETLCLASRAKAQRWYTRVGLQKESTLHKFGAGGEDAVLYVATREKV